MKRPNQKLKLLYLMKILMQETDEAHPLSLAQLVEKLEGYGVEAERKSLYDDMEVLRVFGIDIEKTGSRNCVYYVGSRTFEVAELKLLVDAVQASKFITRKKSSDLIKKMESLASVSEAGTLQRQVYVGNRVKTMNESIYYNVDKLHTAIYDDKKISFRYTDWAVDFTAGARVKRQVRKNGRRYAVSPWALTWNNENYYLVGFDAAAGRIKHYRVDKMESIHISEEKRSGEEHFKNFDMAIYSSRFFVMYGGMEERVDLKVENRLAGVMIDRFGESLSLRQEGEEHFLASVTVAVSPQFFSWLFGLGEDVELLGPIEIRRQYRHYLERVLKKYQ